MTQSTTSNTAAAKTVIYNDDGWSSYMRYPAPMSIDDILRVTLGPILNTAVNVFQFTALGGHVVNYNSKFLPKIAETLDRVTTMHVWRMRETLRHLIAAGTDPLRIVSDACRKHNLACQFSLRMNDMHHIFKLPDGSWYFPELQSPWFDQHRDALLPSGQLDYASPIVHDYRIAQIREILDDYTIDGIDLDFTRFGPWFRSGHEAAGRPLMTDLVRTLRKMTQAKGKTLSARFEYDPQKCIATGLDLETYFREDLFDQITLGGVGDHTPSASSQWFIDRTRTTGCKVCPGIEGQLHWIAGPGAGGPATHAGCGIHDGFGPPSIEYIRAVAAMHYRLGADGISFFNFTCADGPIPTRVFSELDDPKKLIGRDKQIVVTVWPWDATPFQSPWTSLYRLLPGEKTLTIPFLVGDDFAATPASSALLTLDLMNINRLADFEFRINGTPIIWTGTDYNHYDHGCWNDTLRFTVPPHALRADTNTIEIRRINEPADFAGAVEVRKCILDIAFNDTFTPGQI